MERAIRLRKVQCRESDKGYATGIAGLEAVALNNRDRWRKPYLTDQDRICDDETGTLGRLRSPVQTCAFLGILEKWKREPAKMRLAADHVKQGIL